MLFLTFFVSQALGLGSRREGRPNNKEVISGFPATSVSLDFVPLFEAFEACDIVRLFDILILIFFLILLETMLNFAKVAFDQFAFF